MGKAPLLLLLVGALAAPVLQAQGIRDRIRQAPRATKITEAQASDLTLTLTSVAIRPVQVWLRTAGAIDGARKVISVHLTGKEATLVRAGQRARAFPVDSRSSMFQAFVTSVVPDKGGVTAALQLSSIGWATTKGYVVEIVSDYGELLSVPNEAIIEEGATRVVYRQSADGQYEPTPVQTGVQGELYTQVTGGLKDGDQVVTFGSFFIDAEHKLKATDIGPLDLKDLKADDTGLPQDQYEQKVNAVLGNFDQETFLAERFEKAIDGGPWNADAARDLVCGEERRDVVEDL